MNIKTITFIIKALTFGSIVRMVSILIMILMGMVICILLSFTPLWVLIRLGFSYFGFNIANPAALGAALGFVYGFFGTHIAMSQEE